MLLPTYMTHVKHQKYLAKASSSKAFHLGLNQKPTLNQANKNLFNAHS